MVGMAVVKPLNICCVARRRQQEMLGGAIATVSCGRRVQPTVGRQ